MYIILLYIPEIIDIMNTLIPPPSGEAPRSGTVRGRGITNRIKERAYRRAQV
jgi:hypothetical protein